MCTAWTKREIANVRAVITITSTVKTRRRLRIATIRTDIMTLCAPIRRLITIHSRLAFQNRPQRCERTWRVIDNARWCLSVFRCRCPIDSSFPIRYSDPLGDDLPKSDVGACEPSTSVDVRAAALRLSSNADVLNGVTYLPAVGLVTLPPDVLTVIESPQLSISLSCG